ncbi:ferritin-like domain-containing protein [Nocardiopsis baichengensis]|uniref:ferritin-like domain-containing protein n=1 Tax=Nocardiopsis baichengensis TaxID=280240 RepID=UPI000348A73A|nr:ferritin-like domain-containing protein [Nocardiopsis baichengensis]
MSGTGGASPTPSDEEATAEVAALQKALRAEHAAVYGYGFIGARGRDGERDRAARHLDAHRAQRDTVREELVELDAVPAPPEAAYTLPDSDGREELAGFAQGMENTSAQAYLEVAGAAESGPVREFAAEALQAATVRAIEWGGGVVAFPAYPTGDPDEPNDEDD